MSIPYYVSEDELSQLAGQIALSVQRLCDHDGRRVIAPFRAERLPAAALVALVAAIEGEVRVHRPGVVDVRLLEA